MHRVVAECKPEPEAILALAGRYGLLTVSIPRSPEPGQVIRADALPPEPVEIWRKEIRALGACTDLWDAIAVGDGGLRELLGRKLSENLARAPFHLSASLADGRFKLHYSPPTLRAALWQRFAAEVAGLLHPTCPGSEVRPLVPQRLRGPK